MNLQPHIRCGDNLKAEFALLPGDPRRIKIIEKFLDEPENVACNREYKSIIGFYKGLKILAISTGIGGPSTAIAVEELNKIGVNTLIRIGSAGALQKGLKVGELVIPYGAVREDGTGNMYVLPSYPAVPHPAVFAALCTSAQNLGWPSYQGLVRSHDSFYIDEETQLCNYWANKGILASDMETATLFVVGALRGLRTGSLLNIVVETENSLKEGINNYVEKEKKAILGEEAEIKVALEACWLLNKNNLRKEDLNGKI